MRAALTRFVDHFLRVGIRFGQNLGIPLLSLIQLSLNLLRVELAFLDAPAAFLKHVENRFIGEASQKKRNDHEADHLREKEPRIPPEGLGCITQHIAKPSRRSGNHHIHNVTSGAAAILPRRCSLSGQEETARRRRSLP